MGDSAEQQNMGWIEPQLTPARILSSWAERRVLLRAQKGLRRGRPLWSQELWSLKVRRMAELRGLIPRLLGQHCCLLTHCHRQTPSFKGPTKERNICGLRYQLAPPQRSCFLAFPLRAFTSQFVGHSDEGQSWGGGARGWLEAEDSPGGSCTGAKVLGGARAPEAPTQQFPGEQEAGPASQEALEPFPGCSWWVGWGWGTLPQHNLINFCHQPNGKWFTLMAGTP